MSDQASTPTVLPPAPVIPPCYGLPFMQMGTPPARKFKTVEGGRRPGPQTAGRATLKLVGKENR